MDDTTYLVIGSLGDESAGRLTTLLDSLRINRSDGRRYDVLVNSQFGQDRCPAGFAFIYNRLIGSAFNDPSCKYVWILGDDVFPVDDCLVKTQELIESDNSIGVVFPVEAWFDPTVLSSPVTITPFNNELVGVYHAIKTGDDFIEQIYAGFACACISRRAWTTVGPMDESIGKGYAEDLDWGIRCWRAGFRVVNYRRAWFNHLRGATYGRLNKTGVFTQEDARDNAKRCQEKWPFIKWGADYENLRALKGFYDAARSGGL